MIFTTVENALSYFQDHGKHIGQEAVGGSVEAKKLISAYALYQKRTTEHDNYFLAEMDEYLEKWARTQICRLCCNLLDLRWMPDVDQPGFFLFTCQNEDCTLHMQTLASRHYHVVPLNRYLAGKVNWRWDYDLVIERTRHLYKSWQHQARSIHRMLVNQKLTGDMTTEVVVATILLHKTPESNSPY